MDRGTAGWLLSISEQKEGGARIPVTSRNKAEEIARLVGIEVVGDGSDYEMDEMWAGRIPLAMEEFWQTNPGLAIEIHGDTGSLWIEIPEAR